MSHIHTECNVSLDKQSPSGGDSFCVASSPHQVGTISVSHVHIVCSISLDKQPPCKIFSLVSQTMEQSAVKFGGSVVKDVAPGF